MPRELSATALKAIQDLATSEVFLELFTIDPDSESPTRFVRNNEDIVSGGNTYTAIEANIKLPANTGTTLPTVSLSVDNINQNLVEYLREQQDSGIVEFKIVLASSPDTVEVGPITFKLLGHSITARTVTLSLGFEDILNKKFPKNYMTPNIVPSLFR